MRISSPSRVTPALLTRICTGPQVDSISFKAPSRAAGSATSAATASASPPASVMAAAVSAAPVLVGPVAQRHPVAGAGQGHGAGPADAPGAAGHQRHRGPGLIGLLTPGRPQRRTAVDQVIPAPNPQLRTMSPS